MDIMLIMDSGGDGYYSWDFTGLEEARPISEYRQVPDVVDAQSCLQLTELVHWWLQVIPLLVFVGDRYKFVPDALSCVCRMGPTEVFFFFFGLGGSFNRPFESMEATADATNGARF